MAKDGFDTGSMQAAFSQTFAEYARHNRRSRPVLLQHQADQLAFELQRQARLEGGKTKAEIRALPQRLGYRIRRRLASGLSKGVDVLKRNRKGKFAYKSVAASAKRAALNAGHARVSIKQEIRLRLRWAGVYQASGWITSRLGLARGRTRIANPRGRVIAKFTGIRPSITLINQTPGAAEFAAKTGYVARALRLRIADMRRYIARKLGEEAGFLTRSRGRMPGKIAA